MSGLLHNCVMLSCNVVNFCIYAIVMFCDLNMYKPDLCFARVFGVSGEMPAKCFHVSNVKK